MSFSATSVFITTGIAATLYFLSAQPIFALNDVKIRVSSEGDSSSYVKSEISNTNSSSSDESSHSEVTVEQNGDIKYFESNGNNIQYTSPDGNIKVNINNTNETTNNENQSSETTDEDEMETLSDNEQKREIKWLEKTEKEVPEKVEEQLNKTENIGNINPSTLVVDILTSVPNPLTPVQQMVSLIQSAVYLL